MCIRDRLYRFFGVNAETLIDHAWGWEPCTIADIKAYTPENSSLSIGQVLARPYPHTQAHTVASEMADCLAQDLAAKGAVTDQVVLTVGFDRESPVSYTHLDVYKRQTIWSTLPSVGATSPSTASTLP